MPRIYVTLVLWFYISIIHYISQSTIGFAFAISMSELTSLERTNFCNQTGLIFNGTLPIEKGLLGMKVITAIHVNTPVFYMDVNGSSGLPISGFIYDLQNEISSRGSFTFEYVLVPTKPKYMTWTAWLSEVLDHVDIYGNNVYADSKERRISRLGFPAALVDSSLVLVTKQSVVSTSNEWGFLEPFTNRLWYVLVSIITFNGIVLWFVNESSKGPETNGRLFVFKCIYNSITAFTGAGELGAEKPAANILNIGYSFFVLLVIATYTASLASFLISQQTPSISVTSIDDANTRALPICALSGSTAATILKADYPKIQYVPGYGTASDLLVSMRNGDCIGSVLAMSEWLYAEARKDSNPNCDLVMVDKAFRKIHGSWPYKVDYSNKCTSVVEMVLSSIIIDMSADGSLDAIWEDNLSQATNVDCSMSPFSDAFLSSASPVSQYDVNDLAGVIYIYVAALLLAIVVYCSKHILSFFNDWKQTIDPDNQTSEEDAKYSSLKNKEQNEESSSNKISHRAAESTDEESRKVEAFDICSQYDDKSSAMI